MNVNTVQSVVLLPNSAGSTTASAALPVRLCYVLLPQPAAPAPPQSRFVKILPKTSLPMPVVVPAATTVSTVSAKVPIAPKPTSVGNSQPPVNVVRQSVVVAQPQPLVTRTCDSEASHSVVYSQASRGSSHTSSPCLSPCGSRPSGSNDLLLTAAVAESSSSGSSGLGSPASVHFSNDASSQGSDHCSSQFNLPHASVDTQDSAPISTWTCPFCSRVFKRQFLYSVHIRRHTGQRPYQCVVCGRAFSQNSNVKRHIRSHKVWPHLAVGSQFRNQGTDGSDARSLTVVDETGPDGERLKVRLTCPYCTLSFDKSAALSKHLTTVHDHLKQYQCPSRTCRKLVQELKPFLHHLTEHEGQMVYNCPYCNKECHSLRDVGLHQHLHAFDNKQTERPKPFYQCFSCGAQYRSMDKLEQHLAQVSHSFKCPRCDRVFSSRHRLRQHLGSHQYHQKHKCTLCSRVFSHKSTLKTHQQSQHSGVKSKCIYCNRCFGRRDVYRRHVLTAHTSQRLFVCSVGECAKTFNRRDRLREHVVRMHTAPSMAFGCELCERTYKTMKALKLHQTTLHRNNFPFRCDPCRKGFTHQYLRDKHKCNANKPE